MDSAEENAMFWNVENIRKWTNVYKTKWKMRWKSRNIRKMLDGNSIMKWVVFFHNCEFWRVDQIFDVLF